MKYAGDYKDRGKFLTIMLVLLALATLGLFRSLQSEIKHFDRFQNTYTLPPELNVYWLTILVIANIGIFIGILKWKKIALYVLFLLALVEVILNTLFLKMVTPLPQFITILAKILFFLNYGLWFWAIKRKWQYFN